VLFYPHPIEKFGFRCYATNTADAINNNLQLVNCFE